MAALPTPVDLGFAEFVSSLLSETFDSIVASENEQHQRRTALLEAASMDVEDFAAAYVDDAAVDAVIGAAGDTPGDVSDDEREAVRRELATAQLSALRATASQGVPRVVVDEGRVSARLTFQAVRFGDAEEGDGDDADGDDAGDAAGLTGPAASAFTIAERPVDVVLTNPVDLVRPQAAIAARAITPQLSRAITNNIRDVRLQVSTPRPSDGSSEVRASVLGEVEIRFRTVDG